jgi:hypothetical protein
MDAPTGRHHVVELGLAIVVAMKMAVLLMLQRVVVIQLVRDVAYNSNRRVRHFPFETMLRVDICVV